MSGRASWAFVKRSVVARVLISYLLVVVTLAAVAAWSVLALGSAADEARLMRAGYYPLALTVRDLAAKQDTYLSQLNHITAAPNPADLRLWFDIALRIGRPRAFAEVRAAIDSAFVASDDREASRVGKELLAETAAIQRFLDGDADRLKRLFEALDRRDTGTAERLRDELVRRGSNGYSRLSRLEQRVEQETDRLLDQARARERLAIQLLAVLTAVSLLTGLAMALYANRVLRPLGAVTERAKAVASGDREPRAPIASGDEIGELSTTFESMVSAIANANEKLVANERLATIGKMAAHVTHEIRNPLSSIALNLDLLEEELAPDAVEAKALVRAIVSEVDRLSSLSQQYLSFARQRRSSLVQEELSEVVREAAEFMRPELEHGHVKLTLSIDPELRPMPVDEAQIRQALFNLLRNARDAMPHGGNIELSVRNDPDGARIVIDDEGTGLDPAVRARLFEPFFTTKNHGTGLGLAITRQIVQAHGGEIEFRERGSSGAPAGTRVTIVLPRSRARAESTTEREAVRPQRDAEAVRG